ncbi:MAG TPA: ABC transporter ATP-binding protein, partial [Candidatus Binataceae bacterium]|nr:ABC transporter ATP-binding protein [Candidatus Binataceae bacterium]
YAFPSMTLLVVIMLASSATDGAIPFFAKRLADQVGHLNSPAVSAISALHIIALELFAVWVLRSFLNFGEDYLNAYIGQNVTLDIRSDLNRRIQQMPLALFNRIPSGTMMSRVVNDTGLISSGVTDGAFSVIGEGGRLIAVLGAAFWIDWKLALIAFVVFPSAVGPVMGFSRRMRKLTRKAQKQMSGITSILQESYQGNRVVKAFGMEEYERERFDVELRRLFKFYMRAAIIKASTGPMIEVMSAVAMLIAIWYGISSVMSGTRTGGIFIAFLVAMLIVYEPFKRLARINNAVQQSLAAAERVFEMMDQPVEIHDDPKATVLNPGNHDIRLEHVSFRYGKDWVLRDINLDIPAGRMVALVGMSGGGKSTLADLIPRFHDVEEGRIAVDGIDLRAIRLESLRAQIGIVTQHTFLFNDTIRANIAYGSRAESDELIVAAAKAANAHGFITHLPRGYDTMVGELGVRLSGGERQRIAIARALLKDAPILILDEATSSLDSEAERAVQGALETLMRNRTTLVIAHRL